MIVESLSNKGKEQYLVKRDSTRQLVKRLSYRKRIKFFYCSKKDTMIHEQQKKSKILTEEESERKFNEWTTFHHKIKIKTFGNFIYSLLN